MKKVMLAIAVFIFAAIGVMAAPGDVVGSIYSTDILANVNGSPINSYNIGGKTVVLAEELCNNDTGKHYGFDCVYDNSTRTLTLTSTFTKGNADVEISRGAVGEVIGNVYETDIKVIFNSHEVTGYNIGGQTAICIEDLGVYDQSEPNAAYGYSKYLCNAVWNGQTREIALNTFLQETNFFDSYPAKKLVFELNDNQITCTFDQLNPFKSIVKFNFSEQFSSEIYRVKPVYLNGEPIGQMIMKPNGIAALAINDRSMYLQTNKLEVVLTFDEAKKYVADNFEIVTQKEDENAVIYLSKKDSTHYLLFAMKNGGLVCDSKYDSSYSSVTLDTRDGIHYLNLESSAFSGSMPISTLGYDFSDSYEKYVGSPISEHERLSSRIGIAVVTVDGVPCAVDAIDSYEYSTVMVNIDAMCRILGIDCNMYGGVFYITPYEKKQIGDVSFDSENAKTPNSVSTLTTSKVFVNTKKTSFKYLSLVNNGIEKEALPYYYNGRVYVPIRFFETLYN